MYDECAGHGLILDWAASDSHGARAGDGFGLEVGSCSWRRLVLGLRFGTLLGGRLDLNGECCSCQEETEGETKQGFSESNLHFKSCAIVRGRVFHHHDAADSGWEQSSEQTLFSA